MKGARAREGGRGKNRSAKKGTRAVLPEASLTPKERPKAHCGEHNEKRNQKKHSSGRKICLSEPHKGRYQRKTKIKGPCLLGFEKDLAVQVFSQSQGRLG